MGNHVATTEPTGIGVKNPNPNFHLVGDAYGAPTTIVWSGNVAKARLARAAVV